MSTNYASGHEAEEQAAMYLETQGFSIKVLNWKTRYCEIDIVAEKDKFIYFVEVKSRRSSNQGYGLEYVTPKKLKQMQFAAEVWVSEHRYKGSYQLAVIGIDAGKITFVEQL